MEMLKRLMVKSSLQTNLILSKELWRMLLPQYLFNTTEINQINHFLVKTFQNFLELLS